MRKTRERLAEITGIYLDKGDREELDEKLIKEGWVTLDEPREFWVVTSDDFISIHQKYPTKYEDVLNHEIIHVREVIDD